MLNKCLIVCSYYKVLPNYHIKVCYKLSLMNNYETPMSHQITHCALPLPLTWKRWRF